MEKEGIDTKTTGRFFVQAKIWKMDQGIVEEVKIGDLLFVNKELRVPKEYKKSSGTFIPKKNPYKHNVKLTYIEKFVKDKAGSVFSLDQFFMVYPKQKRNKVLNRNIAKLIADGKILQINKKKFKVMK